MLLHSHPERSLGPYRDRRPGVGHRCAHAAM